MAIDCIGGGVDAWVVVCGPGVEAGRGRGGGGGRGPYQQPQLTWRGSSAGWRQGSRVLGSVGLTVPAPLPAFVAAGALSPYQQPRLTRRGSSTGRRQGGGALEAAASVAGGA
ncbi:hypothetical protein CHLRE_13g588501v5 [Chlamydomonas reinhardtii]|uniref:Uncharacterized protein n=1 Tax=Chlamydomonas reinhardtii TaxID=3055 RepID=A0A2K3D0X9_CHLRE|nr:uncharacterized protein CHLRE_13g588501v5 [Chlamydomonas reinhardtii]PNW74182.1 hypothetical protein CHLRE_13g588501v5 [Chlamydomonas reinhardtii]